MAAYKNLRWKILTIVAVIILFAAVGVYPLVAPRFGLPTPAWLMARWTAICHIISARRANRKEHNLWHSFAERWITSGG
jgi:hypothetical protein